MGGLTALGWRSLRARRVRTALTMLGIALGVAVLYAAVSTNATIDASIERTVRDLVGRSDLHIAAFQERGLSSRTVATIRETPGVAVAAPGLERRTYLGPGSAGLGAELPGPVTVLGIDPRLELEVRDLPLIAGSHLVRADEPSAIISERLALEDGLELGSQLIIQGPGEPAQFRVIGILAGNGPILAGGGRTVIVPLLTAQAVFDVDVVTRVDVVVTDAATPDGVTADLATRLLVEPYVLSSPGDLSDSLRSSTADFQAMTALIAAVALFGGALLIFNTLSMTVGERVREVGLLRAAGATRRQVTGFVLFAAAVVGVVGSIVGLVLGGALAIAIAAAVAEIGSVALDDPVLPFGGALVAAFVGIAVTLAASMEPARRAARISPVEALRTSHDGATAGPARLRWIVGVFIAVALVGTLIWPRDAGSTGVLRALVVYGLLLAVTLASPLLLRPLARLASIPFAIVAGFETRLARGAFVRDPSRSTLTVGAMAIGLAMIVALGGVGANARQSATDWLAEVVPGDLVLTSIRPVGLAEGVGESLAALPGVRRVAPIASFELAVGGIRTDAVATIGADVAADGRLRFVDGDRDAALAALDRGGVTILPLSLVDRLGVGIGDTLVAPTADGGQVRLEVVGIVARTFPGRAGETMLIGWADAVDRLGAAGADVFAVRFAPTATAEERSALASEARSLALERSTLDRIEGAISDALARVFWLFDALAVIAVLVAALGIVNTLSIGVLERVREIGILRATGMTRRQVRRMVVVEAGIVGLVGAVIGSLAGIAVGVIMLVLTGGTIDPTRVIPWTSVTICFVLGLGLAMIASAYPAGLAARITIVRAVQFD